MRRELLAQFLTDCHRIWPRYFSWRGCRCARHIFDSGRKCVAMVTAYYGNKLGEILRRELLPQFFFTDSHGIWCKCLPWGVDVVMNMHEDINYSCDERTSADGPHVVSINGNLTIIE